MITADGAGIIATIIPIGLLVLGFEIQRVPTMVATDRVGTFALWCLGVIFLLGLGLGFVAEWILIRAVASWIPVGEIESVVVWAGLWFLGSGSFILLLTSMSERLGLIDMIGRKARARTTSSPRRWARQITYIEKHHPSVRRNDDQ